MDRILSNLTISVHSGLYVKDPETSELGRKIIQNSIELIHEIGFESFTFKKLGEKIHSNESSIYRYFENKHKLLLYLSSWYWAWMEYQLVFATNNISNPVKKLTKAIEILTEEIVDDKSTKHINEAILNKIVISEFTKTFLTKEVDEENKMGYFMVYKNIVYRLIEMIEEVSPKYPYSKTLASTIIQGALHQHYLKDHFKTITNLTESKNLSSFYIDLIKKTLV